MRKMESDVSGPAGRVEKKRAMAAAAVAVILGFACSILTVAVYDRFFAQKVVAVDLAGYVAGQRDRFVSGEITATELTDNIEGILRRMGNGPKNEVLVLDGAVAGNVKRMELGAGRSDEKSGNDRRE